MITREEFIKEAAPVMTKLAAICIIYGAPLWPKRDALNEFGQNLYDLMLADAKSYSLAVATEDWTLALTIAASWTEAFDKYVDNTHIKCPDTYMRMQNLRLIRLCKYYIDAMGINFGLLK